MVKLTMDFIARRTSGYTRKKREESLKQFLRRLTHLNLEDKHIDDVGDDLANCPHLTVLYLYDNELTRVPNLSRNTLLTHLYLQNNQISKLDNLTSLRKLIKLYIGGNKIAVVEGLENLTRLQELHVEDQKLDPGEKLLFDPRSVHAIAGSLSVLNVSGNRLTSLLDLQCLTELKHLSATNNLLSDLTEMAQLMSSWRRLTMIDLADNPICQLPKYRDRIIVVGPHLEVFDGKEVTDTAKQFLKNWKANKDAIRQKISQQHQQPLPTELQLGQKYAGGDKQMFSQQQQPVARSAYIMPALPNAHFTKLLSRSNTHVPSLIALGSSDVQRTWSSAPEASRYLNTYSTYCHDTRQPPKGRHMSRLNIDSNRQTSAANP